MKKGFKLNAAKKFFNILLNREFIKFFGYRNKIQALTEDGFLYVGKRKIFWNSNYGAKTSIDESRVLEGPVNCSSLWALNRCKWLKSLDMTSRILVRIDCTKIAGQILDSSERNCRICLSRSSRFWHIALIVILIILREKEF